MPLIINKIRFIFEIGRYRLGNGAYGREKDRKRARLRGATVRVAAFPRAGEIRHGGYEGLSCEKVKRVHPPCGGKRETVPRYISAAPHSPLVKEDECY